MDRYIGKRLDGRYEIREIIGVGGMAVVYKAFDTIEDRIVAIKILKEEFVTNEEFVRRFKNESKSNCRSFRIPISLRYMMLASAILFSIS